VIPKPQIKDLPVYQPGKPIEEVKRELGLTEVIKLASNENPYGCSPKVKEAIAAELSNLQLYPDGAAVALKEALSRHYGVAAEQLIIGAGSDELLALIARAFLNPGDEAVMATHTFGQYKHNVTIEGAVPAEVPLVDGTHDLPGMLARINDRTKIVFVCNPNNPTGTMVEHAEVAAFVEQVPSRVMIILDEAYAEYAEAYSDFPRSLELFRRHPNVLILRTFSKAYGLASLRVGYGIGTPEVIHSINQVRGPFNTTRIGQAAAAAALADQDFVRSCAARNREGIAYLTDRFSKMGLFFYPAFGNFILVDTGLPAQDVFQALLRKGVIVRGGHQLGFPTFIRVTVGRPEENETFIAALEQVLQEAGAANR
jgi:histidinol-phosphate aminotransferase